MLHGLVLQKVKMGILNGKMGVKWFTQTMGQIRPLVIAYTWMQILDNGMLTIARSESRFSSSWPNPRLKLETTLDQNWTQISLLITNRLLVIFNIINTVIKFSLIKPALYRL